MTHLALEFVGYSSFGKVELGFVGWKERGFSEIVRGSALPSISMTDESGERDGATSNSVPTVTTTSTPRISDELRTYYDKHGIDVDRLVVADGEGEDDDDDETNHLFSAWRFIRLNPRFDRDETLSRLKVRHRVCGTRTVSNILDSYTVAILKQSRH